MTFNNAISYKKHNNSCEQYVYQRRAKVQIFQFVKAIDHGFSSIDSVIL